MAELSPAAQAVLAAYGNQIGGVDAILNSERRGLAAALRALADHQAPAWDGGPLCHWFPADRTRRELLNLATELEACQ